MSTDSALEIVKRLQKRRVLVVSVSEMSFVLTRVPEFSFGYLMIEDRTLV